MTGLEQPIQMLRMRRRTVFAALLSDTFHSPTSAM